MPFRNLSWAWLLIAALGLAFVPALAAQPQSLGAPTRLALTPRGDLLVTDYSGGAVLILDRSTHAIKSRLAVAGKPLGIAWGAGRLFVGNDTTGDVEVYGKGQHGTWVSKGRLGAEAGMTPKPSDIAVDEGLGLVFVVSGELQTVLVFDTKGSLTGTIGGPGTAESSLQMPTGITLDAAAGRVFVSDFGDPSGFFSVKVPARVQVYSYSGDHLGTISGNSGQLGFGFSRPQGTATDGLGRLFLTDSFLGQVLVFEHDGTSWAGVASLGSRGSGPGQLRHPLDVAIDPRSLDVLVTSRLNGRIELFAQGGLAQ